MHIDQISLFGGVESFYPPVSGFQSKMFRGKTERIVNFKRKGLILICHQVL